MVRRQGLNLHGVGSPEDKGKQGKGAKQIRDLVSLGLDRVAAGESNVPDDEDVGNAGDGIPSPLLAALLSSVGSKEAGEDHDNVGADGHDGVCAVNASKQAQVKQEKWRGDSPVDVTSIVRLAADFVNCVGDLAVGILDVDAVKTDSMAVGHAEVGQGSCDGDHSRDVVVETLRDGNVPGEEGEEAGGHDHDDEHNP